MGAGRRFGAAHHLHIKGDNSLAILINIHGVTRRDIRRKEALLIIARVLIYFDRGLHQCKSVDRALVHKRHSCASHRYHAVDVAQQ